MSELFSIPPEYSQIYRILHQIQQQAAQLLYLIHSRQWQSSIAVVLQDWNDLLEDIDQFNQECNRVLFDSMSMDVSLINTSALHLHPMLDTIPDLLIRMRKDGQYLDMFSGTAVKLWKAGQEHALMNIHSCLPAHLIAQRLYYTEQALATGKLQVYEYEIEIDGEIRYEEARIAPNGGEEVLIIVRDITDQHSTNRQHDMTRKSAETNLRLQAERDRLLVQITSRIRQSLDLEAIWNAAVVEVRALLNADRVLFYRFAPDWSGTVVAESVADTWVSMQGHSVRDHCFATDGYIDAYLNGRVHVVHDVERAGFTDCHLEFLQQWQVRANLLVPVLQGQKLYGLFAVQQCDRPRYWQAWEVEFLQKISDHLSIALQQSQLYEQTQQQAQYQQALNRVTQLIRNSLELDTIFTTATTEIGKLLGVEQVNLVQYSEQQRWTVVGSYSCSTRPILTSEQCTDAVHRVAHLLRAFQTICLNHNLERGDDSLTEYPELRAHLVQLCPAWLMIPLRVSDQLWGNLTLIHTGHLHCWQPADIELVSAVADQLVIAIQQSQLYQRLQFANQELERLATTDSLTGVANRLRFDDYLKQVWQQLQREQQSLALILFDVDYFKRLNDQLGHLQGDRCLAQIAQAAQGAVHRPADLLARYGGEEFAVILPTTDCQGAMTVAAAIQQAVHQLRLPHPQSDISPWVTISLGVASLIPQGTDPLRLIAAADAALYQAKAQGRDQAVHQHPAI